jgi:hypothetical protein
MTKRPAMTAEFELALGVFGPQIAGGDTETRQGHQEFDSPSAAQAGRLPRGDFTELVEFRGQQELRLVVELLRRESDRQKDLIAVLDGEGSLHGSKRSCRTRTSPRRGQHLSALLPPLGEE